MAEKYVSKHDGPTIDNAIDEVSTKVSKNQTINGHALSGNITLTADDIKLGNVINTGDSATPVSGGTTKFTTGGAYTELAKKQNTLTSGTTIKTINGTNILSSGNLAVGTITGIKMNGASKGTSGVVDLGTVITAHQDISGKQDKLTVTGGLTISSNTIKHSNAAVTANTVNDLKQFKVDAYGHVTGYTALSKVTSMSTSSTDSQIPTAKAVATYVKPTNIISITNANITLSNTVFNCNYSYTNIQIIDTYSTNVPCFITIGGRYTAAQSAGVSSIGYIKVRKDSSSAWVNLSLINAAYIGAYCSTSVLVTVAINAGTNGIYVSRAGNIATTVDVDFTFPTFVARSTFVSAGILS